MYKYCSKVQAAAVCRKAASGGFLSAPYNITAIKIIQTCKIKIFIARLLNAARQPACAQRGRGGASMRRAEGLPCKNSIISPLKICVRHDIIYL